jgi:hypothetical protein
MAWKRKKAVKPANQEENWCEVAVTGRVLPDGWLVGPSHVVTTSQLVFLDLFLVISF